MSAKTYAMMLSSADSNAVHSALVDTASDLRTALGQTASDLADTASVLRSTIVDSTMSAKTYAMMLSSADSNVVHSALVDTSGDIRGTISNTRTALQSDARSVSSADSNVVHSALADTAAALRTSIGSGVGTDDQTLSLTNSNRSLSIESGNTLDIRPLSDSAMSSLSDTASDIRGTISSTRTALQVDARSVSSSDSNVVHSALTDTASTLRTLIGAAGDDLGNHTATQNIQLNGNYLSNDGGNEGLSIANNGRITINNAYTLPIVDGTVNQVLQTDGSGVVFFGDSPGVTNEHLRNKLDTVTEFISFSCVLDANNNVYLPASGTDESTSINDIAVGQLAPYNGEVVSYSVFSDSNSGIVFGSFTVDATIDFLDNFNTTQNIRSNLGLITAGVSKKVTLGGVFADRSFSQGDILHFRLIIPEAASNQVFHVIAEILYFK